jgi:hypothetical protein
MGKWVVPLWMLALLLGILAVYDYRASRRDPDPFRARLRRWRARGAVLSAAIALVAYLPRLLAEALMVSGWRTYTSLDVLGLELAVLAWGMSIGGGIVLLSWIALATYRRYPGLLPTTGERAPESSRSVNSPGHG